MTATTRSLVCAGIVLSLTGLAPGQPTALTPDQRHTEETRLAPVPAKLFMPAYSDDGRHLAFVTINHDGTHVVVDGQPGPPFDLAVHPVFNADGTRLAYRAKRGDKWLAVVDGQVGPEYDGIVQSGPGFALDGTLEYLAIKAGAIYRVRSSLR